jgi:demethylmenaquinone methyltransferase/2-methoxy-6-polyprenyl-1,4-benzoquinol methylase
VTNTEPAPAQDLRAYYAQRAQYYERVYHKPERQQDLRAMEAWLAQRFAGRCVLEVACGTGWWTPHGARDCTRWLATDINRETIEIAQRKPLPAGKVHFALADAWSLDGLGDQRFDGAFAGCWWSHVLRQDLPRWLRALHSRLDAGARVVLLDNSFVQTSNLPIHRRDGDGNTYQLRTLDDGSVHEVVKNFPTRDEALALVAPHARHASWHAWTHYWALDYTLN